MVELKRVYRCISSGQCWIEKVNSQQYKVMFKRFDNETGIELSPEFHYLSLSEIKQSFEDIDQETKALNWIQLKIND